MNIVVASNNKNKIKEIKNILKTAKVKVYSLSDIGYDKDIKETGETLAENALIKARAIKKVVSDAIIISDDSGLEVHYLAKAPGVYSARFAGSKCSYMDNNLKLLKLLSGVKKAERKADFKTVVAVIFPDGRELTVLGKVSGFIAESIVGDKGFGYDPVFYVPVLKKTYAQMTHVQKNRISHRKLAVEKAFDEIRIFLKKPLNKREKRVKSIKKK